jgi:phosphonate transport system substrate-binding protein
MRRGRIVSDPWLPLLLLCLLGRASGFGADDEVRLVLAVTPWEEATTLEAIHRPILAALEEETGLQLAFQVARSYEDLVHTMQQGQVQLGIFSPVAYVQARKTLPQLRYLATVMNLDEDGQCSDHYRGCIISRSDSRFATLADLPGCRFAFTARNSASGYRYPRQLLLDAGLDPERDFSQVFLLKQHPYITDALVRGSIDAGATWSGNLRQARALHGDVFRVIAETAPIPLDAFAAAPGLDEAVIRRLQAALLGLEANGPALRESRQHGGNRAGFSLRDDAFYDPVRRLLAQQADQP